VVEDPPHGKPALTHCGTLAQYGGSGALQERVMPRYVFEFVGAKEAPVAAEFRDHEAAKHEALRTMAEIDIRANLDERSYAIKIYDEAGEVIAVVTPMALNDNASQPRGSAD
jgi:hypothetical protein